jgi:hypothetical protein
MAHPHSRILVALIAMAGLFLSACDHAKDLVEQGKKQAADIQKSLETKTEEAKSNPETAASTPRDSDATTTPAAAPPAASPAATVAPPPAAADPAMLIEAFLKEVPAKKSNATLQALGALPEELRARITECDLDGSAVNDAGLAEVAKFPNLVKLNLLACTLLTDNGLAAIKDLQKLEILVLERCTISDAGLIHLRKLSNLRILNLNQTAVTDAGFLKLAPTSLAHLEELYLTSVKVDGSCFRRVPLGDSLRVLVAGGTSLGLNLDILKTHRNLEEVNLYSAQVSDKTLVALKGHAKLRILHLGMNDLTDKGARQLTGLSGLENLTFRGNPGISDKCLATFKPCTKLTHFGEGETTITPAGRAYVKKFAPNCTFDGQ